MESLCDGLRGPLLRLIDGSSDKPDGVGSDGDFDDCDDNAVFYPSTVVHDHVVQNVDEFISDNYHQCVDDDGTVVEEIGAPAFSLARENMQRAYRSTLLQNGMHPFDQAKTAAAAAAASISSNASEINYMKMLETLDSQCRKYLHDVAPERRDDLNSFIEAVVLSGTLKVHYEELKKIDEFEDAYEETSYVRDREHIAEWQQLMSQRLQFFPEMEGSESKERKQSIEKTVQGLGQVDAALEKTYKLEQVNILNHRKALGDFDRIDFLAKNSTTEVSSETESKDPSIVARCAGICRKMLGLVMGLEANSFTSTAQDAIRAIERELTAHYDFELYIKPLNALLGAIHQLESMTQRSKLSIWRQLQQIRSLAVSLEREVNMLCVNGISNDDRDLTSKRVDVIRIILQAQDRSLNAREKLRGIEARQAHIEHEIRLCRQAHTKAVLMAKKCASSPELLAKGGGCGFRPSEVVIKNLEQFLQDVLLSKSQICERVLPACFERLEKQRMRLVERWRFSQTWVGKLLAKYNLSDSTYNFLVSIERESGKPTELHKDASAFHPPCASPYRSPGGASPFNSDSLYETPYFECDTLLRVEQPPDSQVEAFKDDIETEPDFSKILRPEDAEGNILNKVSSFRVLELFLKKQIALESKRESISATYANPQTEEERVGFQLSALAAETNLVRVEEGLKVLILHALDELGSGGLLTAEALGKLCKFAKDISVDRMALVKSLSVVRQGIRLLVNRSILGEIGDLWEANVEIRGNGLADRVNAFRKLMRLSTANELQRQETSVVELIQADFEEHQKQIDSLNSHHNKQREDIDNRRKILDEELRNHADHDIRQRAVSLAQYENQVSNAYNNEKAALEANICSIEKKLVYLQSAIAWAPATETQVEGFCSGTTFDKTRDEFMRSVRSRARSSICITTDVPSRKNEKVECQLVQNARNQARIEVMDVMHKAVEAEKKMFEEQEKRRREYEEEQQRKQDELDRKSQVPCKKDEVLDVSLDCSSLKNIRGLEQFLWRTKPHRRRSRDLQHFKRKTVQGQRECGWNASTVYKPGTSSETKGKKQNHCPAPQKSIPEAIKENMERLLEKEKNVWAKFFDTPLEDTKTHDESKTIPQNIKNEIEQVSLKQVQRTRKNTFFGLYDQYGNTNAKSERFATRNDQLEKVKSERIEKNLAAFSSMLHAYVPDPLAEIEEKQELDQAVKTSKRFL